MSARFPIERSCTHQAERFQLAFARRALELMPRDEATAFRSGADGLTIAAETEMALQRPVRLLEEVYGAAVRISPPKVRYRGCRQSDRIEQPIMGLRILCAPVNFEPIREDLRRRGASILDAEVNRRFGIVRACAPLAQLLGYPDALDRITGGRDHLVMWLSHYERLDDPPPAGAAA
ncbi:MAG TPA: hypothetical protein PKE27_21340 [Povalibacter sp.]|uniref:hypothetical protein n=1 Tax=Povalibacter sp. TaxID=1962978 RepID=UPI002C9767C5|nr:hypothetical protein [Povalibacter sp.]HMN47136.1 hypothetical protein [Povalibacter sp.]